ncbi:MAG: hypothetical protein OHK0052_26800 [Anaerolineales bacterium]
MPLALVDKSPAWYYNLNEVIQAVQADFPEWAIQRSLKQAEQIMDAGKAAEYNAAVNWLKIVRDIMLRIGKKTRLAGIFE